MAQSGLTYGYGLAEFDGANWTSYSTSNSGLPCDIVNAIAIDGNENIWIGTGVYANWGGVSEFDGTNWTTYDILGMTLPIVNRYSHRRHGYNMDWY